MKTENQSTDLKFKKRLCGSWYNGYVANLYTSEEGEYVIIAADENSCDVRPPLVFSNKKTYDLYMKKLHENTNAWNAGFYKKLYETFGIHGGQLPILKHTSLGLKM